MPSARVDPACDPLRSCERHHGDRPRRGRRPAPTADAGASRPYLDSISHPARGLLANASTATIRQRLRDCASWPGPRFRRDDAGSEPLSRHRLSLRRRAVRRFPRRRRADTLGRARSRHNVVVRQRRPSASRNSLTRWLIVSGTDDDAAPDALHQIVQGQQPLARLRPSTTKQVERQLRQRDLVAFAGQPRLAVSSCRSAIR